jgi:DNA-binding FadR family transcriptional regulator
MNVVGGVAPLSFDDEQDAVTRTEKVSELVARRIVEDIGRNRLEHGSKLESEASMLSRFKVGRASLREALRILEVYGLIAIKPGPGGGPIVQKLTTKEFARTSSFFFNIAGVTFRELVEARQVLEPALARMAAQNATDELILALKQNVELTWTTMGTGNEWVKTAKEFHALVSLCARNRVLDLYDESLMQLYHERRYEGTPFPNRESVCVEHENIATAIRAHRGDEAQQLMANHMSSYIARVDEHYGGVLDKVIGWR